MVLKSRYDNTDPGWGLIWYRKAFKERIRRRLAPQPHVHDEQTALMGETETEPRMLATNQRFDDPGEPGT